jgi:23S rRNA G2069 N7-methylase RlmK/C1962 C5-methylase RlmI
VPLRPRPPRTTFAAATFSESLEAAWRRRAPIVEAGDVTAYRVLDGRGDGLPGVYLDRYGPAAVLSVHDDARLSHASITTAAQSTLEVLGPVGIEAVYVKPFARDRSRLSGRAPEESRAASPRSAAHGSSR